MSRHTNSVHVVRCKRSPNGASQQLLSAPGQLKVVQNQSRVSAQNVQLLYWRTKTGLLAVSIWMAVNSKQESCGKAMGTCSKF